MFRREVGARFIMLGRAANNRGAILRQSGTAWGPTTSWQSPLFSLLVSNMYMFISMWLPPRRQRCRRSCMEIKVTKSRGRARA